MPTPPGSAPSPSGTGPIAPSLLERSMHRATIRIAQVVGGLDRGGTETWLRNVLRLVDRDRLRMDFIVHEERAYPYEREVVTLGGRVLRCLHPERPVQHYRALWRLFEADGPYDVVHSHVHHYSGIVLAAAARAGVPHRLVHGHLAARRSDRQFPRSVYVHAMNALVRRYATAGLAASAEAAAALFGPRWRQDPRWRVLPCGIDLVPFARADGARVRAELGVGRGTLLLGHVGRFEHEKNHALLLSIMAAVAARRPDSHLVLVGTGSLRDETERHARRLGLERSVTFLGGRSDVPELLAGLDAFVFPSLFEGLGLAAVEAQAAGVPTVMTATLPQEATVVPRLVTRLALSDGPARWADVILNLPAPTPAARAQALELVGVSPYDVRRSASALAAYYAAL